MGQIPWKLPPKLSSAVENNHAAEHTSSSRNITGVSLPGYSTSATGKGVITPVARQRTHQKDEVTSDKQVANCQTIETAGYKTASEVAAIRASGPKDPRIKAPAALAKANIIANVYQTNMPITKAASTMVVKPLELAIKPIHKPSMERIKRHVQIAQKMAASKPAAMVANLNSWQALKDQFCKSKPDKKPKDSRNVPVKLAKMTDVPASCWPLLEAHEASTNM